MSYSWDKFLRPLAGTDTNVQIMDNTENKEQLDNLEVMFDRKKPLQAHTVEFVSVGNTNEKDI